MASKAYSPPIENLRSSRASGSDGPSRNRRKIRYSPGAPHPSSASGRNGSLGTGDPRREAKDPVLFTVLQFHRRRPVRPVPGRNEKAKEDALRRGRSGRPDGHREFGRLQRALSRAPRRPVPAGRHRPRGTQHPDSDRPHSKGRHSGSDRGHESLRRRRGRRPCLSRIR